MFNLKHHIVFFILQNTVSSYGFYGGHWFDYSESSTLISNSGESDYDGSDELPQLPDNIYDCTEKKNSLISHSDIKYLIDDKVVELKIKENFENSYYPGAEEVINKYMGELKEFLEQFNDRPEHMLHILHDMARLRQKLEPEVEEIAVQLEQFDTLAENFNEVVKRSAIFLNQLERYKNICKINCEEFDIENRFGPRTVNNPFIVTNDVICIRLKDLNDNINEKLSLVLSQYDHNFQQQLENRDVMYAEKISDLKNKLKDAAVTQFGMTMYDVLSLQDDYHHFAKDLEHVNISSEIHAILENTAEIDFRLIGLKRDLEKYRQYCMKCNNNQRIKRNVFYVEDRAEVSEETRTNTIHDATNTVDELIKAKIDELIESIESSFINMFEELDAKLDDPDIINVYVSQLRPIQDEIANDIKNEQEALHALSNRIPDESVGKVLNLSKESKQMLESLEFGKQFMDQFISTNFI